MKVLYLEMSSFFVKIIKNIVEPYGYTMVHTASSREAFDLLDREDVKLVLSGTELSDMPALEFLELYMEKGYSHIPVVIFTSRESMDFRQKCFSLGIADYIIKKDITTGLLESYFKTITVQDNLVDMLRSVPIAVLDDSRFSLNVIKNIFTLNGISKVSYFEDYKKLFENLTSYSIFLIDMVLPEISGKEVIVKIREKVKDAVIIVVSGITNSKTVSHALMTGADDYITKPFDNILFMARLKTNVRTFLLTRELKRRSVTDGLTELYNHKYIFDFIASELKKNSNSKIPLCILLLDIDFFKKVNDTYGHQVGDTVLMSVAGALKKVFPPSAVLGRYGGEEFMVVMPGVKLEQGLALAEKYRFLVETLTFQGFSDLHVTISGGIAESDGRSAGELIKMADELLYKSKREGRNRITASF